MFTILNVWWWHHWIVPMPACGVMWSFCVRECEDFKPALSNVQWMLHWDILESAFQRFIWPVEITTRELHILFMAPLKADCSDFSRSIDLSKISWIHSWAHFCHLCKITGEATEAYQYHNMAFDICACRQPSWHYRQREGQGTHALAACKRQVDWFYVAAGLDSGFGFALLLWFKNYFRTYWAFLLSGLWQEHLKNIESPLPWHAQKIAIVGL